MSASAETCRALEKPASRARDSISSGVKKLSVDATSGFIRTLRAAGFVGYLGSEEAIVSVRSDARDGRAQLVSIVAAGRRLVPTLASLADEHDAEAFGSLDRDQRAQLLSFDPSKARW